MPRTVNAGTIALACFALLFHTGCGADSAAPVTAAPGAGATAEATPKRRVASNAEPGVSVEQAEQFAAALGSAIERRDPAAANRLINWGVILDRSVSGLSIPKKEMPNVRSGFMSSVGSQGLIVQLIQSLGEGGSYRLVRIHQRDGKRRALFRMVSQAGANYHDYELENTAGQTRAVNLYVYLSGEDITQTFRRSFIPLSQQLSRNFLQNLTLGETAFVKHIDDVLKMQQQLGAGAFQQSLATYRSLPKELQEDKNMLLLRYQAANGLVGQDPSELLAATKEFKRLYPDDACIDFLQLDSLLINEEYDEALAALGRFEKSVGGDAYLEVLRANVLLSKGDGAEAVLAARRAVEGAPDLSDTQYTLIGLGIQLDDYQAVYDGLSGLEQDCLVAYENLRAETQFAGFLKSELGKKWLSEHGMDE